MKLMTFAVATLGLSGAAHAATEVFFSDFESGSPVLGGSGATTGVQGYSAYPAYFSGDFWRNTTFNASSLSLSGLAAHTELTLSFSIAVLDSWDGVVNASYAPDYFNIEIDGVEYLQNAFNDASTFSGGTTTDVTGSFAGGFNGAYNDYGYTIDLTIAHTGDTADVLFFADGSGFQAGNDESWAIDNLRVTTDAISAVPGPLPGVLLGSALLGAGLFTRRRAG